MGPDSYLTRHPRITSEKQMLEVLKQRTKAVETTLRWEPPHRNPNGTGHQKAGGTEYVVRKTLMRDQWWYWAWFDRKLLGYSQDVEIARNHCEAHALNARRG